MLKVKPKKHWNDSSSWSIVESMNDMLLQLTRKDINIVTIFLIYECRWNDNHRQCFLDFFSCFFVVKAWKQIPLLVQYVENMDV